MNSHRIVALLIIAVLFPLFSSARVFAEPAKPNPQLQKRTREYARAIAAAKANLDHGQIAEARHELESTEKTQRGFEYHYLVARAGTRLVKGSAPDLIETIEAPQVEFRYAVLNKANRDVAYICRDGAVRVYSADHPKAAPRVISQEGKGAISSGAFSSDGKSFVAGFEKGDVVVWETEAWKPRAAVSVGKMLPVRELAMAPDGSAFVAEGESAMELWSLASGEAKKVANIGERYNFGEGLAFSPVGDLIATGGMFDINLFDARSGTKKQTLTHGSYTMGLAFSPDGDRIASAPRGNVNKFLAVFDIKQGTRLFDAGPFPCYVHGGVFTSDGKRVISTACDQVPSLQMYDAATGEVVFALGRTATGSQPGMSHDGRVFGWSERGGYQFVNLDRKPSGTP